MAKIRIFEVGPRDGLQNEKTPVDLDTRLDFISGLYAAGLRDVEVGLFVRPDKVPQMKDTEKVYEAIRSGRILLPKGAKAWSLFANEKGWERAQNARANHLAVFTGVTETFVKKNIGMSISDSLIKFEDLIQAAKSKKVEVRGYISVAFGCPYEGKVAPAKTLQLIGRFLKMGVSEVSIGDTIGVATPADVDKIIAPAIKRWGPKKIAVHFHDTRGTALANALRSYQLGVRTFDSSAGGLGGCPFAPGAKGNLATEDLVYMFHGMKVATGVQLERLCDVSLKLQRKMGRTLTSRYLQAYASPSANPALSVT